MTPQEAFEQQIVMQTGNAFLVIAKQAAEIAELKNQLEVAKQELSELGKQLEEKSNGASP